jgi:TatA/E family protein of Tat protein translocase
MFLGEIFGPDLLIVVIVLVVLLFGGAAIPKLARNLGSAKSEFEKGLKEAKAKAAEPETPSTPSTDSSGGASN